jgi:hypothetical protein
MVCRVEKGGVFSRTQLRMMLRSSKPNLDRERNLRVAEDLVDPTDPQNYQTKVTIVIIDVCYRFEILPTK